jgi:hypothetical protein
MSEGVPASARTSLTVKVQYSWDDSGPHQAVGLITTLGPRQAFVHASAIPPVGSSIRLKIPQLAKSGTVEARGQVVTHEGQKLEGFSVEFTEFVRGEAMLLEFLGLPRWAGGVSSAPPVEAAPPKPEPVPASELEPIEGEVTVKVGVTRPQEPGLLVGVSDTGLYLRTTPGGEEPWQLKQNVRLEFSVPMGHGNRIDVALGRVVRIDPPGAGTSEDPSWGLGIQFREGHAPPLDLVRRIQIHLNRLAGEVVEQSELWQSDDAPEAPALRSTEEEKGPRKWTRGRFIAAICFLIFWVVAVWWLTLLRFEWLIGPPPDPSKLPKRP